MLDRIKDKISQEQPLDREAALWLLTEADLLVLGRLADSIRREKHPDNRVTFVVDRNVNYSNICESKCRFCAFYRDQNDSDAYLLGYDEIYVCINHTSGQRNCQNQEMSRHSSY